MFKTIVFGMAFVVAVTSAAFAGSVTGNPEADGWTLFGNSLENGVYVKGSANYAFQAYGAGFTVASGSNLEISDGALSWLAGDTVVGVGGVFQSITDVEAGWAITGTGVNSLLSSSGPKLQVKFGTEAATWTTSTAAPGNGNGNSSSDAGGGRVQVRTSAYFQTVTPHPDQNPDTPWTWDGNSGDLLVLEEDSHVTWSSTVDKRVARMIWNWDDEANHVGSWQLLLNVSLMGRLAPNYEGLLPGIGDMAIMTVQNGGGAYTDALVATSAMVAVPLPAAAWAGMALMGVMGGWAGIKRKMRRD